MFYDKYEGRAEQVLIAKYHNQFDAGQFSLVDNGDGVVIDKWEVFGVDKPDLKSLLQHASDADVLEYYQNKGGNIGNGVNKITLIKSIAQKKILAIAPMYEQNNMLAQGLAAIANNDLAVISNLQTVWDRINAIRNHSNQLELSVANDINTDITQGWPE